MKRKFAPLILIATVAMNHANAQEASEQKMCPCPPELRHVLGGHAYLPTFAIPTPFADTQTTVGLQFGFGTFNTSVLGSARDLQLGAFQPQIQAQVHLISGLAVNFGVRGNVISGLNTAAALDYGVSTAYAFELGGMYEMFRTDTNLVSVGFDVSVPHSLTFSPLDAAKAGLESVVGSGDPNFTSDVVTSRYAPTLRYAHTFNSGLGLQSFVGMRFDNTTVNADQSTLKSLITLGLGLSSDFKPWIGIPIGLTGNYRRGQAVSADGVNSDAVTVGVYETFSKAFNFGLEAGVVRTESSTTTLAAVVAKAHYD